MPANILVVERDAREAELVRQALAGQPVTPAFVREGEEALRAFDNTNPRLIVLPSDDLVGLVRQRPSLRKTPVVVMRKPFSQDAFLGELNQLLAANAPGHLTSNDIFGDIFEDEKRDQPGAKKSMKPSDDLDKLLADTLSDVLPKGKAKTNPGTTGSLDKKLQDTLSGLEKSARSKTGSGTTPVPRPADVGEKTHMAEPVFPPQPPAVEEGEPTDGTRFGQYVLLEKIASGGMAEVWKARMRGVEGFQKIVAIKKILPHLSDNQEFIEMFIDEAKLAAQLNHANIIHIYDLGKIQSSYYIAMEYVDGFDLKTILRRAEEREQPMPVEVALFIASKIAAALDYAHRKEPGLVHRDVSPQNILISEEGDIKLCDFGIAKAASKASQTQAGALKGKLQYMSPEQAWGKAIDRRSDIFALAVVLFEMLTRRRLFTGDNEMSIIEQVREARVTAPSEFNDEVTPQIDAIVLKALQRDPAARYQTAAEMAKDIDSLLYTFKPTPTSADLAIYMHRLKTAQPVMQAPPVVEEPEPTPTEVAAPSPAPVATSTAPGVAMPAWDAPAAAPVITPFPEKKRSAAIPIAIAAVIALAAIGGFFYMRSQSANAVKTAAVAAKVDTQAPAPAAASATVATAATETLAPAPLTASNATTATTATLDPAKVNEEVQRRLAAERARLEERLRAQQPAAAPVPKPAPVQRIAAQPVTPPPQAQPQPQPAAAVTPTPAPVQPAPQPAAVENRPAPAPQPAAEPVRAREGDLVTEVDVPARMQRRAVVPYPPVARMQRVEGTVFVSALISETGAVLQTRIVRAVSRNVGLNEAAEAIVKRSTFTPAMKDGVRVKAWTTVPIDFKL